MADLSALVNSFLLVLGAEFGDKSQLVCMALAARYRAAPIVLGAVAAFAVLNLLAVTIGAAAAAWLPQWLVLSVVMVLFTLFGVLALRGDDDEEDEGEAKVGRYLIASIFGLIFMAELGDKTQLAMVGLAGVNDAVLVWMGGTLALVVTTLSGVWAGRVLLARLPMALIHKVGGMLFLGFAGWVGWQLYGLLTVAG